MKRQPTMSISTTRFSLSKCVPEKLGDILKIDINKETKQILISANRGGQMALVTYPSIMPIIQSQALLQWIKKELGDLNYHKMPMEWDGEQFIVTPGVKE